VVVVQRVRGAGAAVVDFSIGIVNGLVAECLRGQSPDSGNRLARDERQLEVQGMRQRDEAGEAQIDGPASMREICACGIPANALNSRWLSPLAARAARSRSAISSAP
jgi:hypothetical protein